jgi:hypothetical protein
MTPEERDLLTNFLQDLGQARGGPKDAEAEAMIIQALSRNPDAAYLLVQHAILSDQALHAAQARIGDLERQAGGGQGGGSFLGQGPWAGQQQAPQQPPQPQYAPQYQSQPYAPPPASPFSTGGGLGSFLRNAGTTAAGVVGGEMLFEGLSGLFGGHRGFGGGGFGGGYGGAPVENVTVNNYNDDDGSDRDDSNWDDNSNNNDDDY